MTTSAGDAVTVCIASHNTRPATETAIRLVLAQRGVDVRLRVGDGGSTDGSLQMLRRLRDRGHLVLDERAGGRTHGEWLDEWTASVTTTQCVFVDSDLFLLRRGALRELLRPLRVGGASVVTCELIPEIADYVSEVNGDRYRLAPRVAPWLVAFDVASVRSTGASWCYRWEGRPDLPERAMSYDVGGDVYAAVVAAGGHVLAMPPGFHRSYVHVGGLSWRRPAGPRARVVRRGKRAAVTASALLARVLVRPTR